MYFLLFFAFYFLGSVVGQPAPVIRAIRGCQDAGSVTLQCTFGNMLTITGASFSQTRTVFIDGHATSAVSIMSDQMLIVRVIPGWLYRSDMPVPVIVQASNATSEPYYGVQFAPIYPILRQLTGCVGQYSQYSVYGCKQNDRITMYGNYLYEQPNYQFGVSYGSNRFLTCSPEEFRNDGTEVICRLNRFPRDLPDNVLLTWSATFSIGTMPVKALPYSNRVIGVLFSTSQSSSSSTGAAFETSSSSEHKPIYPPRITRISGCEDVANPIVTGTINCPRLDQRTSPLVLTMYGDTLKWPSPSTRYNVSIGGVYFPNTIIRMPGIDFMTVGFDPSGPYSRLPVGKWLSLTLAWNATLFPDGSSTVVNALQIMTGDPPKPVINRISTVNSDGGCVDLSSSLSFNCSAGAPITISGSGFVLYDPVVLGLDDPRSTWTGTCGTKRNRPGDLICYLPAPPPKSVQGEIFMPKLTWTSETVSWSVVSEQYVISYFIDSTPSSSTGPVDSPAAPVSLDTMYYALLVIMIIAFGVLSIATCMYVVTLVQAKRRAFISSAGAAAVDMRQVLLN